MQFTVFSDKLPSLSLAGFKHEFRTVHAQQTKDMASTLGIISCYVQGLYLPSTMDCPPLRNLPLPEHTEPYQSFAQLSWPSIGVLQAALHTSGYRDSAGKHEFAVPQHLFLTERLEPEVSFDNLAMAAKPVMLMMVLAPKSHNDSVFQEAWDHHAMFSRSVCPRYQRNKTLPVSDAQVKAVFVDTQFPVSTYLAEGGYEEFIFANVEEAQSFLEEHGQSLASSYRGFCREDSWCAMFDFVEQYGQSDIGLRQRIAGAVIGAFLGTKTVIGL
jgi:hypothetical protein